MIKHSKSLPKAKPATTSAAATKTAKPATATSRAAKPATTSAAATKTAKPATATSRVEA
jgi:hypothetical protein